MTIYVDDPVWKWKGKLWCHLLADDLNELHDFANKLGLKLQWFQQPPKVKFPHYDITKEMRFKALKLGAIEADNKKTIEMAYKLRNEWIEKQNKKT